MKPHILLIEKDPCIASLLSYPLQREGYEIHCSEQKQSGLIEAKRKIYDLIVYDLENPETEGMEFYQKLRQHHIQAPVVLLSTNASEEFISGCLRMGAEDCIIKPFGVELFLARIYAVLRRFKDMQHLPVPEQEVSPINLGSLTLFPDKYEATCDGRSLQLSAKEFELLLYLAERKGAVVSRNELATEFWDTTNPKNCRKVDVYMSSIRKKFETLSEVSIQAVRGRGYKIVN